MMQGEVDQTYEELLQPYIESMNEKRCILTEWIQDEAPLEDKDGTNLISTCQLMYNLAHADPSPTWGYIKDASNVKVPQCIAGAAPRKENVLVFEDSRGYTKTILEHSPEGRVGTKFFVQRPWHQYSLENIKEKLGDGKHISMIIFGASLDTPRSNEVCDIIDFQTIVVKLLYYVVKAIVDGELPISKLCVLTRGMFSEDRLLHEQVGLSLTMFSTMFGFCNTARMELEDTSIQLIDTEYFLDPPSWTWNTHDSKLRERLASEVWRNQTFGRNTVRILSTGRYVARAVWATPYAEAAGVQFQLPKTGHIVCISGGNGALGLVMGKWLLDQAEARGNTGFEIQFLSRSAKITDINMPTWQAIEQKAAVLNVKAHQMKADLSTQEAIDNFVTNTTGRLFGFIHSAGVLQDSMIMNMSWEKFDTVWDPKHRAAYFLHDALERLPNQLSFFWLFSSIAVFGNMGQLNYSSSNAALDGLARHRRAMGLPAQTFQWGGWGEVGMAATMDDANRRRMNQGPYPTFSTADGLAGMEEGLKCNVPTCAVFKHNPEACIAMVQPDHTIQMEQLRNWTSEVIPLPPPKSYEDKYADQIHNRLQWPMFGNPSHDHLVWKHYVKPLADEEYDSGPAKGANANALMWKGDSVTCSGR